MTHALRACQKTGDAAKEVQRRDTNVRLQAVSVWLLLSPTFRSMPLRNQKSRLSVNQPSPD